MIEDLKGSWNILKAYRGGIEIDEKAVLEFKENAFQRITGKEKWLRKFEIVPTTGLTHFNIYPQTEPFKNKLLKGIIKIENGQLFICHSSPGQLRPKAFNSLKGTDIVLSISQKNND